MKTNETTINLNTKLKMTKLEKRKRIYLFIYFWGEKSPEKLQ